MNEDSVQYYRSVAENLVGALAREEKDYEGLFDEFGVISTTMSDSDVGGLPTITLAYGEVDAWVSVDSFEVVFHCCTRDGCVNEVLSSHRRVVQNVDAFIDYMC